MDFPISGLFLGLHHRPIAYQRKYLSTWEGYVSGSDNLLAMASTSSYQNDDAMAAAKRQVDEVQGIMAR